MDVGTLQVASAVPVLMLAALGCARHALVATGLLLGLNLLLGRMGGEGAEPAGHVLVGHLLCALCVLAIGQLRDTAERLQAESRAKDHAPLMLEAPELVDAILRASQHNYHAGAQAPGRPARGRGQLR
jgi:hypothetical protein